MVFNNVKMFGTKVLIFGPCLDSVVFQVLILCFLDMYVLSALMSKFK